MRGWSLHLIRVTPSLPACPTRILPQADKCLPRMPKQRSGKSPSRLGDTAKLEKQLPGALEKALLWPLILKRLEFLGEQEGLGPVPGQLLFGFRQDAQPLLTQVLACCSNTVPEGLAGPPRGQRREATLCPAHRLPLPAHPTPPHMVPGLLPREQAGRGRKQGLSTHLLPQTSSGPGSPASPRPLL